MLLVNTRVINTSGMKKDISWQILKGFAVEDKTSFTYQDVLEKFPSSSNTSLSNVLSRMVAKGTIGHATLKWTLS